MLDIEIRSVHVGWAVSFGISGTAMQTKNIRTYNHRRLTYLGGGIFALVFAGIGIALLLAGYAAMNQSGDINGDGVVNVLDLSLLLSHWGQNGSGIAEDLNSDGTVNVLDLSILLSHYGQMAPAAPVNTAPPVISGTPAEGQTLHTSTGTWTGSPTSYAYQWQDCSSSGTSCTDIPGAAAADYTLVAADVGHTMRIAVTATNANGSTTAYSAPSGVVAGARLLLSGVSVPGDPVGSGLSNLSAFETDAGKPVAIDMWYQQWGATDTTQNFQPSWLNNVRNHGSIPEITWEPWVSGGGTNQPAYSLANIINGNFDSYITQWAAASKAWGHPFFLRFAHEMNGNWYPWSDGVNGNTAGQYVLAWRHIHNIFAANGVSNVTWVWSPNVEYNYTTPLPGLYPGDAYVDWTGMDGYNWGTAQQFHTWQSFSTIFSQTYSAIQAISAKPLMIAETGSAEQGGSKASWITDAYSAQLPGTLPNVRAIIWFNYDNSRTEADWRIESSAAAQSAYNSALQNAIYQSNTYGSITRSPIPAP